MGHREFTPSAGAGSGRGGQRRQFTVRHLLASIRIGVGAFGSANAALDYSVLTGETTGRISFRRRR
jgi:hypothetical protein